MCAASRAGFGCTHAKFHDADSDADAAAGDAARDASRIVVGASRVSDAPGSVVRAAHAGTRRDPRRAA